MDYIQQAFSLQGKTALVTGASSGIGQSIAVAMSRAGAKIIAMGNSKNMMETINEIQQNGGTFETVKYNLQDLEGIDSFCEKLLTVHKIDILVNNAGIIRRQSAVDFSRVFWNDVMDVNLHAMFYLTQRLAKPMLDRNQGKVINIASLLSFQGGITVPSYTASKHAVVGLTKALSNEWASAGVQVNAIAPGYIETKATETLRNDPERSKAILERIPAGHWGHPDDIAGAAIFLASNSSNYVNGHVLTVDGGWMAR